MERGREKINSDHSREIRREIDRERERTRAGE